jgi:hypothetical protein
MQPITSETAITMTVTVSAETAAITTANVTFHVIGPAGLSSLQRADREDGRRVVQPHDVRGLRRRVLLALHEGDLRPALPQPVRLHILGKETMVTDEKNYRNICFQGEKMVKITNKRS